MGGLKFPVPLHLRQLLPRTVPLPLHVKQGFAGREVEYTGGWDFVYARLLYRVYQRLLARRGPGGLAAAG